MATLTHQLNGNHENSFEGELPITEVEQVFQARTQQFQHQRIVLPTGAEVVHLRDPLCKKYRRKI